VYVNTQLVLHLLKLMLCLKLRLNFSKEQISTQKYQNTILHISS